MFSNSDEVKLKHLKSVENFIFENGFLQPTINNSKEDREKSQKKPIKIYIHLYQSLMYYDCLKKPEE